MLRRFVISVIFLASVAGSAFATDNFGIGTDTPASTLDVAPGNTGHVVLGSWGCSSGVSGIGFGTTIGACTNYSILGDGGTNTYLNVPSSSGNIYFRVQNATEMVMTSTGSLGIGTTSPQAALDVNGASRVGSTAASCSSSNAGTVQYTSNVLEFCNGTNWGTLESSLGNALSGITAATTTASIDSGANAITWNWNSLSTGTGMTFATSSALTGGTLLSLQATAASATSTGYVLSLSDATTGAGYGVYSAMTATANTGYAIYATNTGAGYALGATGTSYFNGNVGIGTTAPTARLDVQPSGGAVHAYIDSIFSSLYAGLGVTTSGTAGGTGSYLILSDGTSTWLNAPGSGGVVHMRTNANGSGNGGNDVMTLTTTSSVGIGTTAPAYSLQVSTTGGNGLGLINTTNPASPIYSPYIAYQWDATNNGTIWKTYAWYQSSTGKNYYSIAYNNGSTVNTTFTSDGYVGIGTTSPSGQLDVESTATYAGYFNNTATATSVDGVYAATASTTTGAGVYGKITGTANTGYAGYFTNTATSGANYGVYGSDASASGYGGYFTNTNTGGYALYCSSSYSNGCGGSEAWHNTSDIRLKDAVTDLSAARGLASVLKLRPVTFHWKDKKHDQSEHIGLIAQEVEPLYPEVVGTGPDGLKSLSYAELVAPLIKAVQELKADNDNLQGEVDQLQAEVAALKARPAAFSQ